jgi:hypothetical protein
VGSGDTDFYFNDGWIDEIRVSKGVARWTSDFTPPTVAYPSSEAGGGGAVYEISTNYTEEELSQLKYVQSADVLFITSPDRIPRKLSRADHDDWTIADLAFDADNWPPFLDKNITATTITPSAVSGTITLTASTGIFNLEQVGGWFALSDGYCKITGFTDDQHVNATVIKTLTNTDATVDWWESAWSDYRGWPTCASFYEDRLCFSGSGDNPDRIDLSTTSGYENFYRGELDGNTAVADDSMAIYLASRQVNAIKWLAGTRKLLAGSSGAEWWIDGGGYDEPLDATNFARRRMDTEHGSADVMPILIGNRVIFLQRLSKTLREFSFSWQADQYTTSDISILAEHLTNRSNIIQLAWQQSPHQILWALRSDGKLLAMTYMREHDVIGWAQHSVAGTDAEVESIATIEGHNEDELWIIAKRTINGSTKRYIERLNPLVTVDRGEGGYDDWQLVDAFFVDSGLTYRGAPVDTISGLGHLEGETVVALADGFVETGLEVSSGSVTLTRAASVIHIGLNYESDLESLWPINTDKEGLMMGYPQRITNVILMLYKSLGGLIGPNNVDLNDITYPEGAGVWTAQRITRSGDRRIARGGDRRIVRGVAGESEFYTGLTEDMAFGSGWDCYPTVFIKQNEPLPMTVTAIITDLED